MLLSFFPVKSAFLNSFAQLVPQPETLPITLSNLNTFYIVFKFQIFFAVHHFPPADYITHIITKQLFRV